MKDIKWIKTKAEKPKYNERVLVSFGDGHSTIGMLIQEDRKGLKFFLPDRPIMLNGEEDGMTYEIKYWALMPEAPNDI